MPNGGIPSGCFVCSRYQDVKLNFISGRCQHHNIEVGMHMVCADFDNTRNKLPLPYPLEAGILYAYADVGGHGYPEPTELVPLAKISEYRNYGEEEFRQAWNAAREKASQAYIGSLKYHPYRNDDLPACSELAAEAWPMLAPQGSTGAKLAEAYVEASRLASTWTEVACLGTCLGDEVVGLLFGGINEDETPIRQVKALPAYLRLANRLMRGYYGRVPWNFMRLLRATEAKFQELAPPSDAIVQLFIVKQNRRGAGIGRALMDRFVQEARAKKARVMSLYTDPLSNWQFYEKYGFTRHCEFDDELNALLTGKPTKSFIYTLRL